MSERCVVVVGGAQGIGLSIAERLAVGTTDVVIVDLNGEVASSQAAKLPNGRGHAYQCDVSDAAQFQGVAAKIASEVGLTESLVYSAGWTPNKPFLENTPEEERRIVDVNYVGALIACRALLPQMIERRRGRVVFIGSDAGRVGTPKEAIYAGTKAALLGFTKSLAVEVARSNITVNVVSPGTTDTSLLRGMLTEEQIAKRMAANPMKRIGQPEDIAAAVEFFLGEGASFITGQILSVNGGMSRPG